MVVAGGHREVGGVDSFGCNVHEVISQHIQGRAVDDSGMIYTLEYDALKNALTGCEGRLRVVEIGRGKFLSAAIKLLPEDLRKKGDFIFIGTTRDQVSIDDNDGATFEVIEDDILDAGFINRLVARQGDFVIANDHGVEEAHFSGHLHKWVLGAKTMCCVRVPFEESQANAFVEEFEKRLIRTVTTVDLEQTKRHGLLILEKDRSLLVNGGFSGDTFKVVPKEIPYDDHPILGDFATPYDLDRYNRVMRAPIVGELQAKELFAQQGNEPRQLRQLPIKMKGTEVVVPVEFEQFREAIQLVVNHNISVNPNFSDYYVYLNLFRGVTHHSSYRGLSLSNHGDQMQSMDTTHAYNPDYSYIVSSTLPTTLFEQAFDFTEAREAFERGKEVNLYEHMNRMADPAKIYRSEDFKVTLLSPYIVHSASPADKDVERVFMKIAISSKRFYDNREERRNPAFEYGDWYRMKTFGRIEGRLQHDHWNERFIEEDVTGEQE